MNLTFRPATKSDRESLRALFVELQNHEQSVYSGRTDAELIADEYINDTLSGQEKDELQVFVAEIDGEVIGFSSSHAFEREDELVNIDKTYFIEDLVILAKYRGQGVGKQLLDYVAAYAKRKGFKQFGLSVLAANKSARKFYKKYGFKDYSIEYIKKL